MALVNILEYKGKEKMTLKMQYISQKMITHKK